MVKYRLSTFGTSCNWPRVISPTPGRSTLITSAPNHASNCVQVGPDWTWVKSRMRTPFRAFVIGRLRQYGAVMPAGNGHPVITVDSILHSLRLTIVRWLPDSPLARGMTPMGYLSHFLRSTLCGLRLPMRPLSLPAAG